MDNDFGFSHAGIAFGLGHGGAHGLAQAKDVTETLPGVLVILIVAVVTAVVK